MNRSEEQRRGAPRTAGPRRRPWSGGALFAVGIGTLLLLGLAPAHAPGRNAPSASLPASSTATTNLTVAIVASPVNGVAPLMVEFSAQVSGAVGNSTVVTWSFGDGGGGTGPHLNYTYERSGNFTARATAKDGADRFASASIGINVSAPDGNGGAADGPSSLPSSVVYASAIAVGVAIGAIGYRTLVGRRSGVPPSGASSLRGEPTSQAVATERAATPTRSSSAQATSTPAPVVPVPPSRLSVPTEAAGVNLATTASEERRRLSERVITHLLWFGRPTTEGIARAEATQQGMARLLDAGQNSVSKVLLRLEAAGIVKVQTEHVPGAPRRVKTYTLTTRGEAVARAIERASGRRGPSS